MPFEKDPLELGALWEKSGPKGTYFTGTINDVKVVVFKNHKKSSDKSPDYRVLKSVPREDKPEPVRSEADDSDISF